MIDHPPDRRPEPMQVELSVNGERRSVQVDPRATLVELVRDGLALPGTHIGCQTGDCGACTVELDGACVKSCLLLAGSAQDAELITIEGFGGADGGLDVIQQAFWDDYGFQCGFCLPGMLFATRELLDENPDPSEADIREALVGNLCRCTGYVNIVAAVRTAATRLRAG